MQLLQHLLKRKLDLFKPSASWSSPECRDTPKVLVDCSHPTNDPRIRLPSVVIHGIGTDLGLLPPKLDQFDASALNRHWLMIGSQNA